MVMGILLFGLSTGAATAPSGLSLEVLLAMPVIMYAGVGQLAYAQLFALGAPLASMMLTMALVNMRFLVYATIASTWPRPKGAHYRLLAPYFITETSFGLALREKPEDRLSFMMGAGLVMWFTWFASCVVGVLLASQLPPLKHGYAVPAIVLAPVIASLLRERKRMATAMLACLLGMVVANLPYRLGPLVAGVIAVATVGVAAQLMERRR
jgi:predicted branched-subunit amino acid permease